MRFPLCVCVCERAHARERENESVLGMLGMYGKFKDSVVRGQSEQEGQRMSA
jgi:hypothetical protein